MITRLRTSAGTKFGSRLIDRLRAASHGSFSFGLVRVADSVDRGRQKDRGTATRTS